MSNRNAVLKEKVEEENYECKKELEPEWRGKTSAFEEGSDRIEKMKILKCNERRED